LLHASFTAYESKCGFQLGRHFNEILGQSDILHLSSDYSNAEKKHTDPWEDAKLRKRR
jgi:hypothetical protein